MPFFSPAHEANKTCLGISEETADQLVPDGIRGSNTHHPAGVFFAFVHHASSFALRENDRKPLKSRACRPSDAFFHPHALEKSLFIITASPVGLESVHMELLLGCQVVAASRDDRYRRIRIGI